VDRGGLELLSCWLLAIAFSLAFTLSYYIYTSVKRKFDEEYSVSSLLPKRVVHGIVYIIFLVLLHEGVRIRAGWYAEEVEALLLLFLAAIGIPIFLDIIVTLYKFLRR